MKSIEVTGKTVDEAITNGLLELGVSSDQAEIEVIEEASKGLLGLFTRSAKVRITLKEGVEPVLDTAEMADEKAVVEEVTEKPEEERRIGFDKVEMDAVTVTGEKVVIDDTIEQRLAKANSGRKKERREERGEREKKPFTPPEPKVYEIPADKDEVIAKAKGFVEELLKAMGIEPAVEAQFSQDGILEITVAGENMGVIIGKRGATLDSIQYLTTLVVNKGRQDHVHLKLDTEGYRARRQETLEKLAVSLAKKAKRTGHKVALEPMNPYERRIIHSVLQGDNGVETHSDGEEPYRKVIISPRRRR